MESENSSSLWVRSPPMCLRHPTIVYGSTSNDRHYPYKIDTTSSIPRITYNKEENKDQRFI
ncbi:hypothetical protein SESBI_39260 [Sesbania bispinosa]|nr:hypothetical protein SESBI_39260 [Sesbania bispinosa]